MRGKKAKQLRKLASVIKNTNPQFNLKVLYRLLKGRPQKRDVKGE